MSELMKKRNRSMIRTSSLEVSNKMVCPIVKLFKMKYKEVDNRDVALMAAKIINEY